LLLFPALILPTVLLQAPAWSAPPQARRVVIAKKQRPAKARPAVKSGKRPVRRGRRRTPAARCRDIFCTAQVVRLDGAAPDQRALGQPEIDKVMQANHQRLERCIVEARRRDPELARVLIEFVVHQSGRVLASRVNGKRQTPLARCVHKQLRGVRFPRSGAPRTVASFNLAMPQ